MKVQRYYLQSLLCLFLTLSLVFSATLSVSAAESFVWSYEWDIESYGNLGYTASETTMPIEYEKVDGVEYAYYYRVLNNDFLLNADPNCYAYKILMTSVVGNVCNTNSMVMSVTPVVGSYSDILSGNASLGNKSLFSTVDSNYDVSSSWFWVETNYTDVALFTAMLIRCRSYAGSSSSAGPFIDFSGFINVYAYAYTKEEYDAEILQSIEDQNTISQNQLAEAEKQTGIQQDLLEESQKQTELQEEEVETQKGILQQVTDFFGSFFENLKNWVIGIFVPSEAAMENLWTRFTDFFEDRFGFLFQVFTYAMNIFNALMTSADEPAFTLPGFNWNGQVVWLPYTVKLTDQPLVSDLFFYVRMGVGVILSVSMINYLRNFFDKRFGGGGI